MNKVLKACSVLLCIAVFAVGMTFSGLPNGLVAAAATTAYINGTDVNIRQGPSTTQPSLGKLSYVEVTVIGSVMGQDGYTWYNITYGDITGYVRDADYIIVNNPQPDADFELQIAAFPESYKAGLRALHDIYPNWVFQADRLAMSFDTAVANEAIGFRKEVNMTWDGVSWRSMGPDYYNWQTNAWATDNGGAWTGASREVIAYYMDPRNFFNNTEIYMFLQQSYNATAQTAAGLTSLVSRTFLANGYSDPNDTAYGGSYINVIMEAARQSGVNPYIIAGTIILEQGVNGTSDLISGTTAYGSYYNFFNFGASGTDVVGNGLRFAQSQGWDTRSKSIIGGAVRYAGNYISVGQDTYYYKDFNVNSTNPYIHQYAQSVYDARSSGARLKDAYQNNTTAALTFRIPVYTAIPEAAAPMPPENEKRNNYYISSMTVSGLTPAFSMYNYNYALAVTGSTNIQTEVPAGARLISNSEFPLKSGENTVVLQVESESGYINHYTISVNAAKDCTLYINTPDFNKNIEGQCGASVFYHLDATTGVLNITGSGPLYDYKSASGGLAGEYKDFVKTVIVGEGVTAIGAMAFYDYPNLTAVTLPKTVSAVGSLAFYNCTALEKAVVYNENASFGIGTFRNDQALMLYGFSGSSAEIYAKENEIAFAAIYVPQAPIVKLVGATKILVEAKKNHEYSLDGVYWQTSNLFENLNANASYTVYQRKVATGDEPILISAGTVTFTNGQDTIGEPLNATHLIFMRQQLFLGSKNMAADINGDEQVDIRDLVRMKKIITTDFTAPKYGDVNNDTVIDATDVDLLTDYLDGKTVTINLALADVNRDKKIDQNDLFALMDMIQ